MPNNDLLRKQIDNYILEVETELEEERTARYSIEGELVDCESARSDLESEITELNELIDSD